MNLLLPQFTIQLWQWITRRKWMTTVGSVWGADFFRATLAGSKWVWNSHTRRNRADNFLQGKWGFDVQFQATEIEITETAALYSQHATRVIVSYIDRGPSCRVRTFQFLSCGQSWNSVKLFKNNNIKSNNKYQFLNLGLHSISRHSNDKEYGGQVGVQNKGMYLQFYCYCTLTWRLWRHMQTKNWKQNRKTSKEETRTRN